MAKVEMDEFGPVITQEYQGGLRPAGKTKLREGDIVDPYHFGGSTLHGMGKVPGRGMYQEVWLSAPEHKEHYNDRNDGGVNFDFAMASFLTDLATLRRAAPDFNNKNGPHQVEKLKVKREKRLADIGYTFGQMKIWKELVSEGKTIRAEILADIEADRISEETKQTKKTSKGLRC